jgi:hypothetical protein
MFLNPVIFRLYKKFTPTPQYTRAVWKVRGFNLLLRVGTSWKCGDGLFFEVPPLASDAPLNNATPTSRKRAADRWPLRNFLPRSSLFMVGKAQKSHGARSGLYDGCSDGVPPVHFFQGKHRTFLFTTASRTTPGPTQPAIQWVPGALSLGVKRPGMKLTTHLHLVPMSKNEWSYTSTPQIRLQGMVLS